MSRRPFTCSRSAILCVLAASALACGSSPDARPAAPKTGAAEVGAGPSSVGDPRIERFLSTSIRSQTVEDGLKRVALDLRSLATEKLAIAWSVEWFDSAGRPLQASSGVWRRITLPAGGAIPLEISAPVPEADSWRLRAVDSRTLD